MRVIISPEKVERDDNVKVFLAGGISNCKDWQSEVIERLKEKDKTDHLTVISPRCKDFDISDKSASHRQIDWEVRAISMSDIFSMYFTATNASDQPICFYELGRYFDYFKETYGGISTYAIVISTETGFRRELDVNEQIGLAISWKRDKEDYTKYSEGYYYAIRHKILNNNVSPREHADIIYEAYLSRLCEGKYNYAF